MRLTKRGKARNHDQAGSQWSPRQVFVLISVMVLAFALYPVGARAAQVVDAIIRDGTDPSLRATVDSSGALKVAQGGMWNVGLSGTASVQVVPEPYQAFDSVFMGTGQTAEVVEFSFPEGKLLILEFGSVEARVATGQTVEVTISVASSGLTEAGASLESEPQGTFGINDVFSASQPLRLYAAPGTTVRVSVVRSSGAGNGLFFISVVGYLVNA